jgi:hypothetical protein
VFIVALLAANNLKSPGASFCFRLGGTTDTSAPVSIKKAQLVNLSLKNKWLLNIQVVSAAERDIRFIFPIF